MDEENKQETTVVFCCNWIISLPTGIIAIIFGIAGRKLGGKGMGTAGLITGIIGVALCALVWIYAIMVVGSATSSILNSSIY